MGKKRLDYIDIAKGLGMFAIIWGHIMLFGWSNKLVYAFHIPLFFFISGMCYNPMKYQSVWKLINRRVKTLLIPYVFFSIVTWLIYVVYSQLLKTDNLENCWFYLSQTLLAQGSGGFLEHNVALWFVPCLFVVDIIYYYIAKLQEWATIIFTLLCMFVGIMMSTHHNPTEIQFTKLPWSIDSALGALPFYACGNILIRHLSHKSIIQWSNKHIALLTMEILFLTIILFVYSQNNGYVSMGHNTLGENTALFYFNAFIGCFSTILFSLLLFNPKFYNGYAKNIIKFIRWFGTNSFYAMAIHLPLKAALLAIPAYILHTNTGKGICSNIWYSFAAFVSTTVATSFVIFLINKLKFKYPRIGNYI